MTTAVEQRKPVNVPESSSWDDCVTIFRTMDEMMGSAFHAKVQAMRIARQRYYEAHGKNAGFVKKFAEDAGCSYDYARKISRVEQTFVQCTASNFSHDAALLLLEVPPEHREAFIEEHADREEPITVTEVRKFKERVAPKVSPVVTTYEPQEDAEEDEQPEVIEAVRVQEPLKRNVEGVTASFVMVFQEIGTKFSEDDIIECTLRDILDKARENPKLASLCKARAQSILRNRSLMERLYARLEDALQDPVFSNNRIN